MSKEYQVRSVQQSGDRVQVDLQELDSSPVSPVSAVLAIMVIAVIAWAFFSAVVLDPAAQRNRVWTAATDQLLECGDASGDSVSFYWSWENEPTWRVAQRRARGPTEYYAVVVDDTPTGARAQGPGVEFVYRSAERQVHSPGLGTWNNCQVRLTR